MTDLERLRRCSSLSDLAKILDVNAKTLSFAIYWQRLEYRYRTFSIPKKNGGLRLICAPEQRLKHIQEKLAILLTTIYVDLENSRMADSRTDKDCVIAHGFKRDFSILTNARHHRHKRFVFNIDLEDFFPSINFGRVRGFFINDRNFLLNKNVANVIAQIACHNNELPQGSPCSPIISNFIAHILDISLNKLANKSRCSYTRYADDLTFSTNEPVFPASIAIKAIGSDSEWISGNQLRKRIYYSGFKINNKKIRMQIRGSRQETTGLIVNQDINVKDEYYKTARAMCFNLFQYGFCYLSNYEKSTFDAERSLEGKMNFIYQVKKFSEKIDLVNKSGFIKLYSAFLDYKSFFGITKPVLLCEGKTDNIYLKAALENLSAKFPTLIEGAKEKRLISFFNYSQKTDDLQELSGGTGEINKLLGSYRSRISLFKGFSDKPVIIVIDNDTGSKSIFAHLGNILKKSVGGTDPFYYVYANLYVVPVPKVGAEAAIEDLFDPKLLVREINGRKFDRSGKQTDAEKWYGKFEFATKIVQIERDSIDFSRFEQLFKSIEDAINDYNIRKLSFS